MADHRLGKGESLQVRAPVIVATMLGVLTLLAAVAFGLMLLFPNRIGARFAPYDPFPAPAVIPDERAERLSLEARQRRELNGAGGRLPIDQAMRAIAAKGTHAFDPAAP
jgi:hypothetical protein